MFFADHAAAFRNLARYAAAGRAARVRLRGPPRVQEVEESRALEPSENSWTKKRATVAVQAAMASLSDPAHNPRGPSRVGRRDGDSAVVTETTWGRDAADAVGFILSRTPGRAVDSQHARCGTPHPSGTDRGVRLRQRCGWWDGEVGRSRADSSESLSPHRHGVSWHFRPPQKSCDTGVPSAVSTPFRTVPHEKCAVHSLPLPLTLTHAPTTRSRSSPARAGSCRPARRRRLRPPPTTSRPRRRSPPGPRGDGGGENVTAAPRAL